MRIEISSRRRHLLFRTEVTAAISDLPKRPIKGLGAAASELFREEIPELKDNALRFLDDAILVNFRGRPENTAGSEGAEESLVVLEGSRPALDEESADRQPFRCAITTRFLDFVGKDIRYRMRVRCSSGYDLGEHTLRSLCESPQLSFDRIALYCDYFKPRNFSFAGIRLPEVRERISLEASDHALLRLEDTDFQGAFSERFQKKLKICEWLFGVTLNDPLSKKLGETVKGRASPSLQL